MTTLLLLGFLLGMRHAIEADHVAAVATLVTERNSVRQSIRLGLVWGLGHTITLLIFGSVIILFEGVLPANSASLLEFLVGVLLVVLGVDVIRRVYKDRIHFHLHSHTNRPAHFHAHSHAFHAKHDKHAHQHSHKQSPFPLRALFVGLMHGMAGAAALVLLTVNKITSPLVALIYIAIFGFGSMAGMALFTIVIAWPLRRSANAMTRLHNGVQYVLGSITLILGVSIMIEHLPV